MGKKLYEHTPGGGIKFTSHRMGQVRIANYVYDIWLPIIGAKGIAVYGVYCRLEREGTVKAITQADIAKSCRIGRDTLAYTNEQLEECGFIKTSKPAGHKRLMHWTTEISVYDPPKEVPAEIVEKYQHPQGYKALSTWLVASEDLDRSSGDTNQVLDEDLDGSSNVVSLGLNTLEVTQDLPPLTIDDFPESAPRQRHTPESVKVGIAAAIANTAARGEASSWAVPAQAGGSDEVGEALLPIFCDGVGVAVHALPEKKAASWRKALREVADRWGATVEEATTALGGLMAEDGEFAWKTYSTPFQTGFQSDFELMLGRVRSGRPMESKRGQSGSRKDPAFDDGANPYGALTPEEWEQYPLIGDR